MMKKIQSKIKKNNGSCGPSTRGGIYRIYKILSFLQNGSIYGNPVTCSTIGRELEVDRSTVMRDLTFLRDRFLVDFEWDQKEKSYILIGDCNHLPCMELSEVDKLLLEFVEQSVSVFGETELGCALKSSFNKLSGIFTGKGGGSQRVNVKFTLGTGVSDLKIFNIVQRAVKSGGSVVVASKNLSQSHSNEVEMIPTGVVFEGGKWGVVGQNVQTKESVRIGFSEIEGIEFVKTPTRSEVGSGLVGSLNQIPVQSVEERCDPSLIAA